MEYVVSAAVKTRMVTVASPGDAGMLTDEEAEPSDEEEGPSDEEAGPSANKTPVILHGQLVQHGLNDDIADTGTTVLAIETYHEDTGAEGDEVEYGYPITCGDSRAVLLFKKFVCPGINVRCVKFDDQLISPKQFVQLAGKATLKDWKRAIRLGGVMLRKMMDSGQIDFYQHNAVCTNTCRSTKFDTAIGDGGARLLAPLPPAGGSTAQPISSSSSCASSSLTDPAAEPAAAASGGKMAPMTGREVVKAGRPPGEKASVTEGWSYGGAPPPTPTNGHVTKKRTAGPPDTAAASGTLALWQGVADQGLMGQVLSSVHTELLSALRGVERRAERCALLDTDAFVLTSLCETLGLLDSVKRAVERRRCEETTTHTTHHHELEERPGEPRGKEDRRGESRPHREDILGEPRGEEDRRGESRPHREDISGEPRGKEDRRGESRPHREDILGEPRGKEDRRGESRPHREDISGEPRGKEDRRGESRPHREDISGEPRGKEDRHGESRPHREDISGEPRGEEDRRGESRPHREDISGEPRGKGDRHGESRPHRAVVSSKRPRLQRHGAQHADQTRDRGPPGRGPTGAGGTCVGTYVAAPEARERVHGLGRGARGEAGVAPWTPRGPRGEDDPAQATR